MKVIKVLPGKPAKKGAAAVVTYKVVSFVRKGGKKLIVIPIAAGGGLAAYKKLRSSGEEEPATPYGSPVGPVATPATVTPPKTAPGANTTLNGEVGDTTTPAAGPESTSAS